MAERKATSPPAVFLNVPFDSSYESQFIALVAAVVALGRTPRCVLEVAEQGSGRLSRLLSVIGACDVSLHDLSRVGMPARFNMPFELGLACAVAEIKKDHAYILLEKQRFRLQRTLSDLNGRDPYIHNGTIRGTIDCVLDSLRATSNSPAPEDVFRLYRTMSAASLRLTRNKTRSLFSRSNFLNLVAVGITRAEQVGLIDP